MDISTLNVFLRLASIIIIPLAKIVLAHDETVTTASARFVVSPTAASVTSEVATADTTAYNSSVSSTVDDNGSSHSASSEPQSSDVASKSISASASAVASSPMISSHWSNATASSKSSSALPLSSSASLILYINTTSVASPLPMNTKPACSTSYQMPGSNVCINAARSSSSILPDPNARINLSSSASSTAQGLNMTSSSASSASYSSSLNSIAGSTLDAAIYLSSLCSTTFIQSDYGTRSFESASQGRGTSLSSNGTTFGLSHVTTQVSSSIWDPTIASTVPKSSKTISLMNAGDQSTASSIPSFITSGPIIALPITTINPTGSVASAAGFSLGGLIFGIADQRLSDFITNSASTSSYISQIETVESKWDHFYKEIGGDDLPSNNTVCKRGGLVGLLNLAGCIASGLDMIKIAIKGIDTDNPGPWLTEIEGLIANVAEMAKEEESEEDDDDDDDQPSTQDESRPSKTSHRSSAPRTSMSNTAFSSSAISSSFSPSISSSISSSIVSSGLIPCDSIVPQALPAVYSINTAAAEVVLEFVGDILFSVFDEEISGFTTSTLSNASSLATSGTAVVSPQGTTTSTSGWIPTVTAEYSSAIPPSSTQSSSTLLSPSSSTPPSQNDSALTSLLTASSSVPVYRCTMMYVSYPFIIRK